MSARQARALRSLAEPIVAGFECDLEDVTIRQAGQRRLVRVTVDHVGGLPLDLVADISRALSRALDESDLLAGSYVLEVSSPGVHRPLTQPRHWARAQGRLIGVTPRSGAPFVGRLLESDEGTATFDVQGATATVAFSDVARAVVEVEFTRIEEIVLPEVDDPEVDDPEVDGPEVEGPESVQPGGGPAQGTPSGPSSTDIGEE